MTCKDCFHFEVCDSGRHIGEYDSDEGVYTEGVEKECPTFKNKANFVEVGRCKDCRHCEDYDEQDEYGWYHCAMHEMPTKLDNYCNFGERSDT